MGLGFSRSRRVGLVLFASVLSMAVLAVGSQAAGQYIYWSNTVGDSIGRANIDGSSAQQDFLKPSDGVDNPRNIAVSDSYIYWANETTNTIGRANLDGSGANAAFITAPGVYGIAVDKTYIYWTSVPGNSIGRANINGSGVNENFILNQAASPRGVYVTKNQIYWANFANGAITSSIGKANIDGSGANKLFVTATTNASGIAVDKDFIYWANPGDNKIGRVNIDGSSPIGNFVTGSPNAPSQLALGTNFLFWGDSTVARVGRVPYNGSGLVPSFVAAANPTFGVALSVAAPAIAMTPPTYDYGTQPIGSNTNQSYKITNTGNAPLNIFDVSIAGTGASQFLLSGNDCQNQLGPGAKCTVSAKFVPSSLGSAVANIVINNSTGNAKTITLSGTGSPQVIDTTAGGASSSAGSTGTPSTGSTATPTIPLTPPVIIAKRPGILDCVRLQKPSSKFIVQYSLSGTGPVETTATLLYIPRVKANIDSCRPGPKGAGSEPHFKTIKTIKATGKVGKNRLAISAKGLKPGRYRIRFSAKDAQNVSAVPKGANFLLVFRK